MSLASTLTVLTSNGLTIHYQAIEGGEVQCLLYGGESTLRRAMGELTVRGYGPAMHGGRVDCYVPATDWERTATALAALPRRAPRRRHA